MINFMPYRGEIIDLDSKIKALKYTTEFKNAQVRLEEVEKKIERATLKRSSEIQMRKDSMTTLNSFVYDKLNLKQELIDKEY